MESRERSLAASGRRVALGLKSGAGQVIVFDARSRARGRLR